MSEHDGTDAWRAGIEASIRRIKAMQDRPRDLCRPAYFAALDEALVRLEAMLERGSERSSEVCD